MSWGKKLGGKKPSRIVVRLEMEIENPLGVCLCWSWSVERTIELSPAAREKQNTRTRQNRETRDLVLLKGAAFFWLASHLYLQQTRVGAPPSRRSMLAMNCLHAARPGLSPGRQRPIQLTDSRTCARRGQAPAVHKRDTTHSMFVTPDNHS
jgi:hypothetical protein